MRNFHLVRIEDETSISGTGMVAEGVEFSTGKCVLAWTTQYRSIAVYDTMDELIAIHGHNGKTEVQYIRQATILPETTRVDYPFDPDEL